jgi:hypothetical protein
MTRRSLLAAAAAAAALMLAPAAAAASAPAGFYGVVQGEETIADGDLEQMAAGGVGALRVMVHRGVVEPLPGAYDWRTIDDVVRRATAHGITPFLFLYGSPAWSAQADGFACTVGGRRDCSVFAPRSDATRAAFAAFARAAVRRYGPGGEFWQKQVTCALPIFCQPGEAPCACDEPDPIRVWQIWNEQNSSKYFAPRTSPRAYAELLAATSEAIRAEDPGAEVVLGGMWGPRTVTRKGDERPVMAVTRYLERLYRVEDVASTFDSIALHPYSATLRGVRMQMAAARRVVRRAGDGSAGTWVTELGWASAGPAGNPYVVGRGGQARMLARSFRLLERNRRAFRLRGVFWYTWRDGDSGAQICSWCAHAGLRTRQGAPKPAWNRFVNLTGGSE